MMTKDNAAVELTPGEETLLQRLKRIEGQVRGLQRMVTERRACHDIITQLLAARSALDKVGLMLLDGHLERCFPVDDEAAEGVDLSALRRTLNLWIRFGN